MWQSLDNAAIASVLENLLSTQVAVPIDTDPPDVYLYGDSMITLRIASTWTAAMAYAIDQSTTTITSRGAKDVQAALQTDYLSTLDDHISSTAGMYGPWIVSYTAIDEPGNQSPPVFLQVYIDATCPEGEEWCPESDSCATPLLCMPRLPGQECDGSEVEVYIPPVDVVAPILQLTLFANDTVFSSAQLGPHIVETHLTTPSEPYTDPGWYAFDDVDGNVSLQVSAFGMNVLQSAVASASPTDAESPLAVQYRVSDSAGNAATAVRLVHIVCASEECLCYKPDGSAGCTVDGLCDITTSTADAVVPAVVQLLGPDVVFVPQGSAYSICTSEMPLSVACDKVCPNDLAYNATVS